MCWSLGVGRASREVETAPREHVPRALHCVICIPVLLAKLLRGEATPAWDVSMGSAREAIDMAVGFGFPGLGRSGPVA